MHRIKNVDIKMKNVYCRVTGVLVVVITCVIALVIIFISRKGYSTVDYSAESELGCHTQACLDIGDIILGNLDESMDPCKDFYQYACGNYEATTELDKYNLLMAKTRDIDFILNEGIKELLETASEYGVNHIFHKLTDFYVSCTDIDCLEHKGERPLQDLLVKFGGWPVIDGPNWNESEFNWQRTMVQFLKEGFDGDQIISVTVTADETSLRHLIQINGPSFKVPVDQYLANGLNDTTVTKYHDLMIALAESLGMAEKLSSRQLCDAIIFETDLLNATRQVGNSHDFDEIMSLKDLEQQIPLDLVQLLSDIVSEELNDTELISVRVDPKILTKILNLVHNSRKSTIANYMMWRMLYSILPHLGHYFGELWANYESLVFGVKLPLQPRWKFCVQSAKHYFGKAVGNLYVKKYFTNDTKIQVLKMVNGINTQIKKFIEEAEWMDEKTRKLALEKANMMEFTVGYSDEILNDTLVDNYYSKINNRIKIHDYFATVLSMQQHWADYNIKKLRKPRKRLNWEDTTGVAEFNAYYNYNTNQIEILAGIIQELSFSADRPNCVNYGILGGVIGHEIMHAFDDVGRKYDKFGFKKDWWDSRTVEKYANRSRCIIQQYENYTIPAIQHNVDGVKTLDENIADNSGVKAAYLAYRALQNNSSPELSVPNLEMGHNKLFWISFATGWCVKLSPTSALQEINSDHSPNRWRVNGAVSNSEDFARDFQCSAGSPMNPSKKCIIW